MLAAAWNKRYAFGRPGHIVMRIARAPKTHMEGVVCWQPARRLNRMHPQSNCGQIQLISCTGGIAKIETTCREAGCYAIELAEGVGFEPTVRLPVQQFSSPPDSIRSHSTASAHMQAPLGNREAEYTSGRQ